jgi:integral membrane sensor domain MASE1
LVVVGAIYLAAAKLSLMLASVNPSASPIWPPTGLALAAIMLLGYRMWPAILIAAFAANLTTAGTAETAAMIAAGNTLECLAGAFLTLLWTRGLNPFLSPSGVLKFTLVAVGIAAATSAGAGIATLYLAGLASAADLPRIGLTWWLGNLAGALVVTPPVVLWASGGWRGLPERRGLDVLAVLVTAAAAGVLTFSPALDLPAIRGPLAFLTIVPLVWSALRLGPRETATVALVLSGFAVWGAIVDGGPFLRGSVNDSFLMLVMFMITVSVPSLTLSADVAARRRSENDLRATQNELDRQVKIRTQALAQANQRLQSANEQLTHSHDLLADTNVQLKEAQRMASLGSWVWEIEPNRVTWSDQLYEIYGISPDEFGGTLEDFA